MRCSNEIVPMFRNTEVCPRMYNCTDLTGQDGYTPLVQGIGPSIVAIISCSLSILGSLLILYTYVRWKDVRTGSRSIITFLAIADFFTALGYVIGSVNYIVHFGDTGGTQPCRVFQQVCQVQSFLTSTSSLSSFAWTSILAVYLYLIIVKAKINLAYKLMPLYHVIAWLLPILIILPLLCVGRLGYSSYAASNWCYIGEELPFTDPKHQCGYINWKMVALLFIAGKAWEIATYILVVAFYAAIKWHIYRETRGSGSYHFISTATVSTMQRADKKLTFIPIVFILLRMWGTMQLFYALIQTHNIYYGCTPHNDWIGFTFFAYVQAVGDGGQGWGNVILYVISSPKIRYRLWYCICHPSWRCLLLMGQAGATDWPDNFRGAVNEQEPLKQCQNRQPTTSPFANSSSSLDVSVGSGVVYFSPERNSRAESTTTVGDIQTA